MKAPPDYKLLRSTETQGLELPLDRTTSPRYPRSSSDPTFGRMSAGSWGPRGQGEVGLGAIGSAMDRLPFLFHLKKKAILLDTSSNQPLRFVGEAEGIRMTPYRFATTWHVRAPVQDVWDALQRVSDWWPGMVLSRKLTPDREGVGARYERLTRGLLPYSLRYVLTITRHDPPRVAAYDSEGDLVGEGGYVLTQTGPTTEVRFTWNVATRSRWMNILASMLKPLFAWNHNYVMRQGEKAIQRYLDGAKAEPDHDGAPR
jgi:hypothetical protein